MADEAARALVQRFVDTRLPKCEGSATWLAGAEAMLYADAARLAEQALSALSGARLEGGVTLNPGVDRLLAAVSAPGAAEQAELDSLRDYRCLLEQAALALCHLGRVPLARVEE